MRSFESCISVTLMVLRSWDGLTLYAVSSDGTLAAFCFDPDELEGIAPHSIQQQYLQKFGFTLPPLPEGWSHTNLQTSSGHRMTPPPSPNRSSHPPHGLNGFGAPSGNTGQEVVNTLIAKRNTKRRTQQQSLGPRGVSNSAAVYANSSYHDSLSQAHSRTHHVTPAISSGLAPETSQHPTSSHSLDWHSDHIPPDMVTNVLIDSLGATSSAGAKRKSSVLDMPEDRPTKARTLGGDRVRDSNLNLNIIKEICSPINQKSVVPSASETERKPVFSAPPVLTFLSLKVTDAGDDMLECKNAESGGRAVLIVFLCSVSSSLWV